jgi:hypothetical protein
MEEIVKKQSDKRGISPSVTRASAAHKGGNIAVKQQAINKISSGTTKQNIVSLKEYFESKGFSTIDRREKNGCLWVLGEKKKLEPYVSEAMKLYGATGAYGSGKQSNYKPAWWTKSNK